MSGYGAEGAHEESEPDNASPINAAGNNPFAGRSLRGRARHTILWGEAVVVDGEAQR